MRFKRPKNGHYTKYCFGCRHYEFERQVGCAYLGKCTAIEDEPTEQDAYDPPCGLWEKRADTPQTDRPCDKCEWHKEYGRCIFEYCHYEYEQAHKGTPQTETQMKTQNSNLTFEKSDCPWR